MIDAGLPVAMASDYNPGSSPSGNMKLVMSLGCIRLQIASGGGDQCGDNQLRICNGT